MEKTDREFLCEAIKKWGAQAQLLILLEEMSELQKEILKNINRQADNIDSIIEETADVEIMLEQLKYIYNIHCQVEERIPVKLQEVKEKLED